MRSLSKCLLTAGLTLVAVGGSSQDCLADNIYIADFGAHGIVGFNSSGARISFDSRISAPVGLAKGENGDLYVGDCYNSVWKIDRQGQVSLLANTLNQPAGLACFNGSVYVANTGNNTIQKIDSQGHISTFVSAGLAGPTSLVFDHQGNLYVANYLSSTIQKFDLEGNASVFATAGIFYPYGMTFDSDGYLYVANELTRSIEKLDANGIATRFASTGTEPLCLAFDSEKNLYASTYLGNSIMKFDSQAHMTPFGGGLSEAYFIVAVPEPADLPIMLVIAAGVEWARRRRAIPL